MNKRVHRLFSASIENRILAADKLEKSVADAATQLVQCLLNNGKIFIFGQGYAGLNSQHFSEILLNHVELERPPLPVIALTGSDMRKTAVRQVQALGQAEDILILLSVAPALPSLMEMIQTAHDKEIPIIALTCDLSGLSQHLGPQDSEICVPGQTDALIHETQLFVLECFCDLIEQSLFGQAVE
jgi:D-sedoheptulose 7-phosphate isomerase